MMNIAPQLEGRYIALRTLLMSATIRSRLVDPAIKDKCVILTSTTLVLAMSLVIKLLHINAIDYEVRHRIGPQVLYSFGPTLMAI